VSGYSPFVLLETNTSLLVQAPPGAEGGVNSKTVPQPITPQFALFPRLRGTHRLPVLSKVMPVGTAPSLEQARRSKSVFRPALLGRRTNWYTCRPRSRAGGCAVRFPVLSKTKEESRSTFDIGIKV